MELKKERSKITDNLEIKIISVVLALLLWFYAQGQQKSEIIFNIPLEVKVKENMIVYDQSAEFVSITLRSQESLIKGLNKSQFRVLVNMKENQPGMVKYELTSRDITGPSEVEIIDVYPQSFSAKIDYMTSKTLPVKVITDGELPEGYVVEGYFVEPANVTVEGVMSKLDNMNYIETTPFLIRGAKTSFANIVKLKELQEGVTLKGDHEVKVTVKVIKEERVSIPLSVIYNTTHRISITPKNINAIISGDNYILESINKNDFTAVIDVKNLGKGEHFFTQKDIKFNLPEKISLKDINPKEISINLE